MGFESSAGTGESNTEGTDGGSGTEAEDAWDSPVPEGSVSRNFSLYYLPKTARMCDVYAET